jgi:aryl-alcohol dehydrogenase-like predicted oxidoreductase
VNDPNDSNEVNDSNDPNDPNHMEYRAFGNTGLQVPVVGMGTWHTFDVRGQEAAERNAVTDAAFETGATFFDSSPMYGEAERVLGRTLRGRRDEAIVATKVWTSNDREAMRQITASLAFFRRRVDVFQVHNLVAWRTRLDQLQQLRDEGAVRAIGITHYAATAADDLLRAMKDPRVRRCRCHTTRASAGSNHRSFPLPPTSDSALSSCGRSAKGRSPVCASTRPRSSH